jgi:hypothetical protein
MLQTSLYRLSHTACGKCLYRSMSGFSRMLDMGGAPSAMNDRSAMRVKNASKHSKVQVVCFDFDVLTQSIETLERNERQAMSSTSTTQDNNTSRVEPNASLIEQVASLLNVSLGGNGKKKAKEDDDLSRLSGEAAENKKQNIQRPASSFTDTIAKTDPRTKYASKLAQKQGLQGGIASIELAKNQVEDTLRRGDAAGHLAARQRLVNQGSQSQWLALTGTGQLLQYLTRRSIQICLLPVARDQEHQADRMERFQRQLAHQVVIDHMYKEMPVDLAGLFQVVLTDTSLLEEPHRCMLVSDQQAYLRAAKDAGMVLCQIRPPQGRHGNVSPHYSVPTVPDVLEVINEINGISYKALQQ